MSTVLDRIEMKCRLKKELCNAAPLYVFHKRMCKTCGSPFVAYYKENQSLCHHCDPKSVVVPPKALPPDGMKRQRTGIKTSPNGMSRFKRTVKTPSVDFQTDPTLYDERIPANAPESGFEAQ